MRPKNQSESRIEMISHNRKRLKCVTRKYRNCVNQYSLKFLIILPQFVRYTRDKLYTLVAPSYKRYDKPLVEGLREDQAHLGRAFLLAPKFFRASRRYIRQSCALYVRGIACIGAPSPPYAVSLSLSLSRARERARTLVFVYVSAATPPPPRPDASVVRCNDEKLPRSSAREGKRKRRRKRKKDGEMQDRQREEDGQGRVEGKNMGQKRENERDREKGRRGGNGREQREEERAGRFFL